MRGRVRGLLEVARRGKVRAAELAESPPGGSGGGSAEGPSQPGHLLTGRFCENRPQLFSQGKRFVLIVFWCSRNN